MLKTTDEFINDIKNGVGPQENNHAFINEEKCISNLKKMVTASGVPRKEIVDYITPTDKNGYKYLCGDRKMQRNILIKICIACQQNLDDTAKMLKMYGFIELYPRLKSDYIIIQGIIEQLSVEQINQELAKNGQKQL